MKIPKFSEIKTSLQKFPSDIKDKLETNLQKVFPNADMEDVSYWGKRALLLLLLLLMWVYIFRPFDNFGSSGDKVDNGDSELSEVNQSENDNSNKSSDSDRVPNSDNQGEVAGIEDTSTQQDTDLGNDTNSDPRPASDDNTDTDGRTNPTYNPPPQPSSPTLKPNGQTCSSSSECSSGYCVDGFCCNNACSGTCETCGNIDGTAGDCHYIADDNDPEDECEIGEYTCNGKCSRVRGDGACDGNGACDSNDDVQNIASGKICVNDEVQDVSASHYCFQGESCDNGDCSARRWYTSCDGEGSCRPSTEHTDGVPVDGVSQEVYPENGYTLTDTCESQGSEFCDVADPGRCDLNGCRVSRVGYRCSVIADEGSDEILSSCGNPAGFEFEYCPEGTACSKGSCSEANVCDNEYVYFEEVDDECKSSCNGMGICNSPSSFCEQRYRIINLRDGIQVYKNSEVDIRGSDVSEVPQLGAMNVNIWKKDSEDDEATIVADVPIEFVDKDLDWVELESDTTGGKAFLHYPGGIENLPGVDSDSYALYIPISEGISENEGAEVWVCPQAERLEEIKMDCEGGFLLSEGKTYETDEGTIGPVTIENIADKKYWRVPGLTSTGAFTLAGIKDTCSRLQVSVASDHEIRFIPTFSIDSSDDSIEVDFVPNQITTDGSQDYDFNSIGIDDISLEDDGVEKTLGASSGNGIWGVSIDSAEDKITFTAPSDAGLSEIDSGSVIYIRIGTNAGGDTQIINPAQVANYDVSVRLTNGDSQDFGEAEIPVVDDDTVNVTGYIDTVLTFDIDTAVNDINCDSTGVSACDSHGSAGDGAGYVVDLGEMTLDAVNRSGTESQHSDGLSGFINYIWFDIETNAASGATVSMISANEALKMDNSNQIDDVADGDEQAINPASGLYGINHRSLLENTAGHGLMNVAWDCDCTNGDNYYCDVSDGGVPIDLFDTNGGPIDDGRIQFAVGAAPTSSHPTGTYTDQLTFVATSTF